MFFLLGSFIFLVKAEKARGKKVEKHFVIFSAGRNHSKWVKKHLDSIFNQKYDNYEIIYIDDASTDGSGELAAEYIKEKGMEHKVRLIINEERKYKMANQYHAIHEFCKDSDIVVEVDADDWLANNNVLSSLNKIYSNSNIWLTYGKYRNYPSGKPGYSRDIPKRVRRRNGIRRFPYAFAGLRTFYAGLFKLIKKEDLYYQGKDEEFRGKFTPITSDGSIMYPMLEMCQKGHYRFIKKVMHITNRKVSLPTKYSKRMLSIRKEVENRIKKMKKYPALDKPLWEIS